MGRRNYGIGSRDMRRAGQIILRKSQQRGAISYSTEATNAYRWGQFVNWSDAEGIKLLEHIDRGDVIRYGEELQDKVEAGEISEATAQNYVSAVNRVMGIATDEAWKPVSPTKDCGISFRSGIAKENRAISELELLRLIKIVSTRLGAIMMCQRELGLRFEESVKLNASAALAEATASGVVTISAGTKGGLKRFVPSSCRVMDVLTRAAAIQCHDRSMITAENTYAQFQRQCYSELSKAGGSGFHGLRHAYAQQRYFDITGAPAPIVAGWSRAERFEKMAAHLHISQFEARTKDHYARQKVAEELGHHREAVTNAYLG